MGKRRVQVCPKLLAELFDLPEDWSVVDVEAGLSEGRGLITLVVESPEFETVPEGRQLPTMTPTYSKGRRGNDPVVFWAWRTTHPDK